MYGNDTVVTQLNAKELILAKINATPELVDIYTYLLSIGTPFKAIADIMSSRAFNAITKIGESNIFDESTHGFKVKDMIGFYTGDDVPNAIKFGLKLGYIPSNEQANKAIEQLNSDINTQEKRGGEHKDYIINEKRNTIKLYELIKFRNDSWNSLTEQEKAVVGQIYSILPAVEEMSNLGRILGINQGQPTKIYELGNMKKMIPNFMNTRGLELNFDQFLINSEYQQAMIDAYEGIKLSYNILDVLATVPHFREMLKTLYYSERAIRLFSARNNTIIKLRDELEENIDYRNEKTSNKKNDPGKIALSKIDFQALDKYINDRLIIGFLLGSGFMINVPDGAKRYNSYTDTPDHTFNNKTLSLNDDLDVATFKYIMDKFIIKDLKKKYAGNAFFDNLRPLADPDRTENVATGWKLSLQMMNIDASPNTQTIYSEILNGLDEVANNTEYGQTIGDLFYIYNMIVNKDAFGQSSMTRVFENLLLRGTSKYINMYSQYISQIDGDGDIDYNLSEARYRILKANPNSRVKLTGLEKEQLNTKSELGPDFTLDVPITGKQRNGNIVNINTFEALEQAKEIGEEEILDAIIDNINNNAGEEIAFIVDDDEIRDEFENDPELNKMLNSRGFVKNGSIYIRHESWLDKGVYLEDIPVLMHEYAHLVLASIKYGTNAQTYYKLLAKVQNDPMFEKYASKYPTAVGSDLMEEVFVSMIEDYLSNRPIKGIDMDEFSDCILTGIREMLQLDIAPELKDLINQPLKGVIKGFASGLFNVETLIDKQQMMNNAKVRALKERLFTDGFLKQEC